MYTARVVKVMIASPADVAAERVVIRDVLHEWNPIHSEDRSLALLPVGWDTHAHPTMGDRPQAIINKQVLRDCDLLIAVFWTRLETPTGESASGTVEEIDEHLRIGKPAMLYFSDVPVRLDTVDDDQHRALREFRASCASRGLIETYETIGEFREKLARQLAQRVIQAYGPRAGGDIQGVTSSQAVLARDPVACSLTPAARELVLAAVADKNGAVIRTRTMQGLAIRANERNFVEGRDPRSEATWDGALRLLRELNLIRDLGHKGEIFNVTDGGYQAADRLRDSG